MACGTLLRECRADGGDLTMEKPGPKLGDVINRPHGRNARVIAIDGHFIQLDYPRLDEDKPTIRRWIRIPNDYTVLDHA